jgi:hypothetical protein
MRVIRNDLFCSNPHLTEIKLYNKPIEYIFGHPFARLPSLVVLDTDDQLICCTVPETVKCLHNAIEYSRRCPHILPNKAMTIIVWVIGLIITILNLLSLVFWHAYEHKKSSLVLMSSLNLSDMLMGIYMILVAITDTYYNNSYSAYSVDAWQSSWICGWAMLCNQVAFQMGLWVVMLISLERLLLTKYALLSYKLSTKSASTLLFLGLITSCVLGVCNVYWSILRDQGAPSLCLFISSGKHVRIVQWATSVYNVLVVVALTGVNITAGVFFITKQSIVRHMVKYKKEHQMVRRILMTTGTSFLSVMIIGGVQVCTLTGSCPTSDPLMTLQLVVMAINATVNPFINTFTKTIFVMFIKSKLSP